MEVSEAVIEEDVSLEQQHQQPGLFVFCRGLEVHSSAGPTCCFTLNLLSILNTTVQLQGSAAWLTFLRFSKHLSQVPASV